MKFKIVTQVFLITTNVFAFFQLEQFQTSLDIENYNWKEMGLKPTDQGQVYGQLLEENGALFGGSAGILWGYGIRFKINPIIGFKIGRIDYDGSLQDGTPKVGGTFYNNSYIFINNEYALNNPRNGWNNSIALGFNLNHNIRYLGSLGWNTKIDSSGYVENWTTASAKPSYNLKYQWLNDISIFLKIGIDFPFYCNEFIQLPIELKDNSILNSFNIYLKPNAQPQIFSQMGFDLQNYQVQFYYHPNQFNPSPPHGGQKIYQPLSKGMIIGLNLGYRFKPWF